MINRAKGKQEIIKRFLWKCVKKPTLKISLRQRVQLPTHHQVKFRPFAAAGGGRLMSGPPSILPSLLPSAVATLLEPTQQLTIKPEGVQRRGKDLSLSL